jgi:hypothetical protein
MEHTGPYQDNTIEAQLKKMVYETKHDPNKVVDFTTGASRSSNEDKGRYDLIPVGPVRRIAIKYQQGAKNHGDRNWEKGMPFSRLFDSAKRHLDQYLSGDRTEDHLAAAAWNIFAVMHFEEHMPEMNDLPDYKKVVSDLSVGRNVNIGNNVHLTESRPLT